jgi:hypothetical protein
VGVGVDADSGQFQFAAEGAAIERFDIDQLVAKLERPGGDLVVRQGVKHECVVRIGTVADANELFGGCSGQGETPRQGR